jgi:sugar-specific transcriptional regulator TrmB
MFVSGVFTFMNKLLLEEIGLSRNEVLAYESLLGDGEASPPLLSERIKVSRENSYYVLNSLTEKGLAEKKEKGKKLVYAPKSPEIIKDLLEKQKQRFSEREKSISALIPELNNLYSMRTSNPSISYFEGVKGIRQLYKDALGLDKPGEMLVFRSPRDQEVLSLDWIKEDNKRLTLAGINIRLISPRSAGELFSHVGKLRINRKIRYSSDLLDLPTEICVIKDRVSIVNYRKDRMSALIISKDFADSMRHIFDYVWETLED